MSTCNRLDLVTLGSQSIMPKTSPITGLNFKCPNNFTYMNFTFRRYMHQQIFEDGKLVGPAEKMP